MKKRLSAFLVCTAMAVALFSPALATGTEPVIRDISAGDYHVLAVDEEGGLWAWGWNQRGELGDAALDNSGGDAEGPYLTVPAKVMEDVASASAGFRYSAAVKTDGSLWVWGDGTAPEKILDGVRTAGLSTSLDGGTAVMEDDSLWLFGENALKQVGLESSDGPVRVMEDVADACLVGEALLVLTTDGTLLSIWYGDFAEPVHMLDQVAQIAADRDGFWALKTDGTLWESPFYDSPTQVMDGVLDAALGRGSGYIVKDDGTLWAIGGNTFGELGNGTVGEPSEQPVQILTDVVRVESGDCYALALKTDGAVWSWGVNSQGQLGTGGKGNGMSIIGPTQSVPIRVNFVDGVLPEEMMIAYPGVPFAIMVDGGWTSFSLYGLQNEAGDLNYYVRLRDVAAELSETPAAFGVEYDGERGVIALTTHGEYRTQGGDGDLPFAGEQTALPGGSKITVDGVAADLDCFTLTDSAGGGHTYFKLRDLGRALGFNVRWDSEYQHEYLDVTGRILIETDKPYTES